MNTGGFLPYESRVSPWISLKLTKPLGVMGLKQPLAPNVAEYPLSDRMLKALQELGGETGGFVEL